MSHAPDPVHIVALADVRPQPWRNGGGQTRELLAWPAAEAWQVRVSVADITQNGPFSPFPEVQRHFAVLEGAGVVLVSPPPTQTAVVLNRHSPAYAFDGAEAPDCRLLDGPTRDLNLMTRDGRSTMQAVQPLAASSAASAPVQVGVRWRGLYTATAACLHTKQGDLALPAMSLAWQDVGDAAAHALPWRITALPVDPGAATTATGLRAWWLHWSPSP